MNEITKEEKQKILKFLGYNRIVAYTYEYNHRCGTEVVALEDIWVHKDTVLYYRQKEESPFAFKVIHDDGDDEFYDTDDIEHVLYYHDDEVYKPDFLFYKLMDNLHKNNITVISKEGVVIILDGKGNEFVHHGNSYYINFFKASLEYIDSLKK